MKKLLKVLVILLVLQNSVNYCELKIDEYLSISSSDINSEILQLKKDFPNFVEIETLGKSVMGKKIRILRISSNISSFNKYNKYDPNKKNSLYISGLHAKEVIAPVAFLKIIRNNLESANNGNKEVLNMLSKNVIHYIPLVNPDGFDLAKFGNNHIIFGQNFNKNLKSNAKGVDLNNNFPDKFYDIELKKWNSIKNKAIKESEFKSELPSVAYYHGKEIQPEVKIVINYMNRFYFDFFIDIHSQGNYIYWDNWNLSDDYRKTNLELAKYIQKISSNNNQYEEYRIQEFETDEAPHGYGYSTAYYSSKYGNPTITLETTVSRNLPYTKKEQYIETINRFDRIFVELDKYNQSIFPYRVYKNGQIFGDYIHKEMAIEIAKKINGIYRYELGNIKTINDQDFFNKLKYYYSNIIDNTVIIIKNIVFY